MSEYIGTHLDRDMNSDIRRNDLASHAPRNLIVLFHKQALTRALCEGNNNVFLRLEHRADGRVADLQEDGDLVFERLAVGR